MKQYSVAPPDDQSRQRYQEELPLPEAVNALLISLDAINGAAIYCGEHFGTPRQGRIGAGIDQDEAIHKLMSVYPDSARGEEFLHRATCLSTFVDDGLCPEALRHLRNIWFRLAFQRS